MSRQERNRELYVRLEIEKADIQKRLDEVEKKNVQSKILHALLTSLTTIGLGVVSSYIYNIIAQWLGWQ